MVRHTTGQDVDAHCNRCKLVLAHVIIAMNEGRILRVECKTCRDVHAYRAQASGVRRRESGGLSDTKAASRKSQAPADYEKMIQNRDLSHVPHYGIQNSYIQGDAVSHGSFGIGIVMRVLADSKMEVLFPTGMKVLIHQRL